MNRDTRQRPNENMARLLEQLRQMNETVLAKEKKRADEQAKRITEKKKQSH